MKHLLQALVSNTLTHNQAKQLFPYFRRTGLNWPRELRKKYLDLLISRYYDKSDQKVVNKQD